MDDMVLTKPDFSCLVQAASGQHGHFTTAQARSCGIRDNLLNYHTKTGRFVRVHRGVYRLRDHPSSPREEVVAAWLAVGHDTALVSHESALDLLGLSDVIPSKVHLTVPRARRNSPRLPGVAVHTTTRPPRPVDVAVREGVRLTSAARSILDAAESGTAPEQIEMAVGQAVARGLVTRQQLEQDARARGRRVYRLVAGAFSGMA